MENPGDHFEQAEQANEALSDPFNKRVTLSIAIVAAFLAAVSMFGQNSDNEALLSQGDALRLQSDALQLRSEALRLQSDALRLQGDVLGYRAVATLKSNEAANKWAQYQANNIRGHMYTAFADLIESQAPGSVNDKAPEKIKGWRAKFEDYENKRLPKLKEEAEALTAESNKAMAQANTVQDASEKRTLESTAQLVLSDKKLEEAESRRKDSEGAQTKADRFDFGELGLQLGVVLCSLAILTRSKGFWFAGIGSSLLGLILAASGLFGWFLAD